MAFPVVQIFPYDQDWKPITYISKLLNEVFCPSTLIMKGVTIANMGSCFSLSPGGSQGSSLCASGALVSFIRQQSYG